MYCKTVIITTCFIANCSVFAGLQGETFHLGSELTDTPLLPGGLVEDFGNFVVGDGIEWSQTYPVWDFQDPQVPLIGEYTYFLDVGDDYIEITATWTLFQGDPADPYLSYFSLLPAEFYGFHLNFVNPTNLSANQQFQITSTNAPVGQMGDLNLFAKTNPPLEQWVDSQSVDPISPTRITVGETSLDLNTQGIAWGWFPHTAGVAYTESARIDFAFDCPEDTTADGVVNVADILQLFSVWGPCAGCNEDLDNNGTVNIADLLVLLGAWGACP